MELIPPDTDICVCTDLDEVFRPGWRKLLENAWEPGAEQLRYTYIWSFGPGGTPGTYVSYRRRSTRPACSSWHHPVHEVLRRTDGQRTWKISGMSGDRAGALSGPEEKPGGVSAAAGTVRPGGPGGRPERPLPGAGVYVPRTVRGGHPGAEAPPGNARSRCGQPERCASMRFLSRCYLSMGDRRQGMVWALRAIAEAPELREPWVQAQEASLRGGGLGGRGLLRPAGRGHHRTVRLLYQRGQGLGRLSLGRHGVCLLPDWGCCGRQEHTESRRCWRNRTTRGCWRTCASMWETREADTNEGQGCHRGGGCRETQRFQRGDEVPVAAPHGRMACRRRSF